MKAFLLAAGRGTRMQGLTKDRPKPLLEVKGRSLIEHQVAKLVAAGISDIVINTAYLGQMIEDKLGDGSRYSATIHYSREPEPLETGGGIYKALPLFDGKPFLLVNSDVWLELDYTDLQRRYWDYSALRNSRGYLVLVDNPSHNRTGDFCVNEVGEVESIEGIDRAGLTFSGVSILHPQLISDFPHKRRMFPLREALDWAIEQRLLHAEKFAGYWLDVGTPERLAALEERIKT